MAATLSVSDRLYQRLIHQAAHLGMTPEQLLERLLTTDLAVLLDQLATDEAPLPVADSHAAQAAVGRLTSLFADLTRPDLDALLDDPQLALANVDPGDARP